MTVNASVLTADVRTVPASWRAVLGAMLIAPLLVSAGALLARHSVRAEYQFIGASSAAHENLMKYQALVGRVSKLERGALVGGEISAYNEIAREWIGAVESDKLKPLNPVASDDTSLEGVKGQIYRSAAIVASRLAADAENRAKVGDFEGAASEAIDAFKILESMYGNDILAISMTNQRERRIFFIISKFLGQVRPETRGLVEKTVSSAFAKRDIAGIAKRAIAQYEDLVRRDGFERITETDRRMLASLPTQLALAVDPFARMKQIRSSVTARPTLAPRPVIDVTLAYLTEAEGHRIFRDLLKDSTR